MGGSREGKTKVANKAMAAAGRLPQSGGVIFALVIAAALFGSTSRSHSSENAPWRTPGWETAPAERIALLGDAVSVSMDPTGQFIASGLQYPFVLAMMTLKSREWTQLDRDPHPDSDALIAWKSDPCRVLIASARGPSMLRSVLCSNAEKVQDIPLLPDEAFHRPHKIAPVGGCDIALVRWRDEGFARANRLSQRYSNGERSGAFAVNVATGKVDAALTALFPKRPEFVGAAEGDGCTAYFGVQQGNDTRPTAATIPLYPTDVYELDLRTKQRRKLATLDKTGPYGAPGFAAEMEVSPSRTRAIFSTSRTDYSSKVYKLHLFLEIFDMRSGRILRTIELPQPAFRGWRLFHYQWLDDRYFLFLSGEEGMFLADSETGARRQLMVPKKKVKDAVVDFSYARDAKKLAIVTTNELLIYNFAP